MQALSTAASGITSAMSRFDASAVRMSSGNLDNLPADIVEQTQAKVSVQANAAVFRSAADMEKRLLDILA
jgi:hypothetical protein